jgi:hypothetical protein
LNRIYEYNLGLEHLSQDNNKKKKKVSATYEIKQFDYNLIKMLISFRSRLFHETNIKSNNDELLMFPNNKDNISIFEKNNYTSIVTMLNNMTKGKKSKLQKVNNINDIEEVLSIMPKYTLKVELLNNKFPEAGNLLSFNIKVIRGDETKINSNDQKELGYLHSNNYFDNYEEEIVIVILDSDNKGIYFYDIMKFEYINEEKKLEYDMLVEKQGKNNFEIILLSLSYPGIIISHNTSIEIKEENDLISNFVKNRYNQILSEEEFQEKYGCLNEDIENEENNHEHKHND